MVWGDKFSARVPMGAMQANMTTASAALACMAEKARPVSCNIHFKCQRQRMLALVDDIYYPIMDIMIDIIETTS